MPTTSAKRELSCDSCGAELRPGSRYCPECGRPVRSKGARATFGPRYAAFLVDLSIVVAAWLLSSLVVSPFLRLMPEPRTATTLVGGFTENLRGLTGVILLPLIAFVYSAWYVARRGTTPGKKIVGLRVVAEGGRAPGALKAALRSAVLWGPFLLLTVAQLIALLGAAAPARLIGSIAAILFVLLFVAVPLTILLGRGRGLHDRVAGTDVVRD